jgi:hypothetical protein
MGSAVETVARRLVCLVVRDWHIDKMTIGSEKINRDLGFGRRGLLIGVRSSGLQGAIRNDDIL